MSELSGEFLAKEFYSMAPKYRTKEKLAEMVDRLLNEAYQLGLEGRIEPFPY